MRTFLAAGLAHLIVLVLGGCTIFGAVVGGALGATIGGAEGALALAELGMYVGAGIDGAIIGEAIEDRSDPHVYPPHDHADGPPPVILIQEAEQRESGLTIYTYEYVEEVQY